MKDLKEVLWICAVCLFLGVLIVIGTTYANNTGTGLLSEQGRIAQAYAGQVQQIETLAKANATNAQADAIRAEAESKRAISVVIVVGGLVVVFILVVMTVSFSRNSKEPKFNIDPNKIG